MDTNQIERRIDEIEEELLRDDPELDAQFAKLDHGSRRHDATVFALFVSSAVLLLVGLATMSVVAWLAGVICFVASFSVDTRHDRELRDLRDRPRRHHSATRLRVRVDQRVTETSE